MKTLKVLLLFLLFLGVANNVQAQNNQIFVLSKELVFSNNTIIYDLKLGGDSVFLQTEDLSGIRIIILDSNLRKVDTIKQNFIPGAYYAPRIAVFNGRVLYSYSDDSLGYLYLYSFSSKSWRLILERPKINSLFLMRDKYFIFGDSLYKLESNFNITPMDRIERPLLIEPYADENDSTVIFSYTSSGFCVNLVTVNKVTENVEKRKICFGSQFSYSDNVTLSPKGKIYFSIVDSLSITRPPSYFMLVIKVFEMNDIRSNPELLYIYIGAADSSSLLSRQTAFKYHDNNIYGVGYTQFLGYYSTFFTLFDLQTRTLHSYIRKNDKFSTYSGEFGRKIGEIEYFSCEYAYGYGQTKVRKYIPDPTSVDDLNQSRYEYVLYQNYPNPFNPITKIRYELKEDGLINMKILNALGQEIIQLIHNEYQKKGTHEIEFDASKYGLSSGVYLYQLISGNQLITRKMILIK
jgi:hypothetical protein